MNLSDFPMILRWFFALRAQFLLYNMCLCGMWEIGCIVILADKSCVFSAVQLKIALIKPIQSLWMRFFFIIYSEIRMLCDRDRGFSVLCSFSDVKGNIMRYYVSFSRPACSRFRPAVLPFSRCRFPVHVRRIFRRAHCGGLFFSRSCCHMVNFPAVFPLFPCLFPAHAHPRQNPFSSTYAPARIHTRA